MRYLTKYKLNVSDVVVLTKKWALTDIEYGILVLFNDDVVEILEKNNWKKINDFVYEKTKE